MDSCGDESRAGPSRIDKRKSPKRPKDKIIPFRVFLDQVNPCKREFFLRLAKPDVPSKDYPQVTRRRVSALDKHALYIMHNLNHRSVVSMKAYGRTKSDELSMFLENGVRVLGFQFLSQVADKFQHIPSPTFQAIVREIIDGVDFLWRNKKYHGNLSWDTTMYQHPYIIELAGFKWKDLLLEQAQWGDCLAIIAMLEGVVNKVIEANAVSQEGQKIFYDEVNALIDTLKALDRNSLLAMRDTVFEEVFFWTSARRARFATFTILDYLHDEKFIEEVEKSDICGEIWNSKDSGSKSLDDAFEALLKHCNDYRDGLTPSIPHFNPKMKIDCVHLVYAAYTHRNQIQGVVVKQSVDFIICAKFPKLFLKLNRIIKQLYLERIRRADLTSRNVQNAEMDGE